MTTATREQFQRAIDKAQALRPAVADLGNGQYQVAGSRGDLYRVTVDSRGEYTCSCPAGEQSRSCYHQGRVYLLRVAEQAGGQRPIPAVERAAAKAAPVLDHLQEWPADLDTAAESDADTRQRIKRELNASIARWSEVDDDPEAFASIYGRKIA